MFSGVKKKLMKKDGITLTNTDIEKLIDDITDKFYIIIQITLIVGFTLGAISMAIVDKIVG